MSVWFTGSINPTTTQFAYSNTLPNTKTAFPPSEKVFRSDAPWAQNSGFDLPASLKNCGSDSFIEHDARYGTLLCRKNAHGTKTCVPISKLQE